MLLKVNCQRYAYKLSLSNLAPLPLIHRHEKRAGRGRGRWLPSNQLADALMELWILTYYICESLFLFALSKPHFYLHLIDRIKSKSPAMRMTTLLCPRSLSRCIPSRPLQHRRREPPKAPTWLGSTSQRGLSALRRNRKTRTHSRLPDEIKDTQLNLNFRF